MKNIYFNFLLFGLVIVIAAIAGCKPVQVIREEKTLVFPQSFDSIAAVSDSANSGAMNWRDFFPDPNLQKLIDTALLGNYDLQIAARRIQQMEAGVMATEAPLHPTVQAAGSAGIRRFGLYTMDGAGNVTTDILPGKIVPEHLPDFFAGVQAGWEIDLWGK
ncbi:MAG: TolC family protein, partial [Thermoanaerobaculia bacterium]|nr:TolC family protein [Thermoanaerobaculia bacterium]